MKTLLFGIALVACHTSCMAATAMSDAQASQLGITSSPLIADDTAIAGSLLGQVHTAPQATQLIAHPFGVQVVKWHVTLGQQVTQDQDLLVAFSPTLLELEHQLHNALSTQKLTQQRLARDAQLVKEGISPRKQLEATQDEATQASENVDGLLNQLEQMGLSDKELKKLKAMQHLEGKFTVQAPVSGKVSAIYASVGQSMIANTTLITLIQSSDLIVEIPMPPLQAAQLRVGQMLTLEDNTPLRIEAFRTQLSDAQKTIVLCSAAHAGLTAGQWVRVNLPSDQQIQTWRIPRNAITHIDGKPHIFIRRDNEIEAQSITLIRATRDGWVISAPALNAETRIIVSGTAAAKGLIEASK